MRDKLRSFSIVLLFNLISLSLIFSVLLYKMDFVAAQGNGATDDDPVLLPRESEQTDDEDGGEDDMGDGDGDDLMIYTVQRGDTLRRIAAKLGVSYRVLAAQTNTPSLIFAGQQFVYSPADQSGASSTVAVAKIENSIVAKSASSGAGQTWEFTVRQGDTLSHIALWLGVSLDELAEQVDNPRRIFPGQRIAYVRDERIDTPPLLTDNDGTDSDGIDTTGQFTDNDGTDSDGVDTTGQFTDNDGTDSDGIDTTGQFTDNDGTDSDGIDTTGQFTDNDGTDSDGIDTTGQLTDNDGTDSDGIATSQLTDNDGTDSDGIDTTGQQDDTDDNDSDDSGLSS